MSTARTYLVTGGTGFLGQHLVRQLLKEDDAAVVILARSRDRALERLGARFVTGSVLVPEDLDAALAATGRCDGIYHLAGRVERHVERANTLYNLHVNGTRHVLEAAARAGVKRIVVASTSGTVGVTRDGDGIPNDRSAHTTELVKDWPYYLSKVYAEKTALATAERLGLDVILMRPTLLLGPGDDRLSSTRDVKLFLDGKVPFVPTGGLSFVDVRDTAVAFRAAMERGRPGAAYLLGAANMTMEAFFERLENISGVGRPLVSIPDQVARIGARLLDGVLGTIGRSSDLDPISVEMSQHFWYIDWSAAIHDLGFAPRDPGETLYDTVQWLKSHGHLTPGPSREAEPAPDNSPFSPDRPWSVEARQNDAAWNRPATDAYGEHREHPPAPTAWVGQSKVLNEDLGAGGPGLESLVGGLVGGAITGLLGRGKKAEAEPASPASHDTRDRTRRLRRELIAMIEEMDEEDLERLRARVDGR